MDCTEDTTNRRISPLRGLDRDEMVKQMNEVKTGLGSLRDDHYNILTKIQEDLENQRNNDKNDKKEVDKDLFNDRIANVTQSLEQLELGIEESSLLMNLSDHFEQLQADRFAIQLEMSRVQDENDWLREELDDTQRKLREALLELTELQEEKVKWDFEEELRNSESQTDVRPVTPSKIPVGAWRVEEEKDINRALNGDLPKAKPVSRIPVGGWRSKSSAYKAVMDKEMAKKAETDENKASNKRQYFKINATNRVSKIPGR